MKSHENFANFMRANLSDCLSKTETERILRLIEQGHGVGVDLRTGILYY